MPETAHANPPADDLGTLRQHAQAAFERSDAASAIALLSRATRLAPADASLFRDLGLAYRAAQRYDAARFVLDRAVELAPADAATRLVLAHVLELDARPEAALLQATRALADARRQGRWRDDASIEPGLSELVEHARSFVRSARAAQLAALQGAHPLPAATRADRLDAAFARMTSTEAGSDAAFDLPGLDAGPDLQHLADTPALQALAARLAACVDEVAACLRTFGDGVRGQPGVRLAWVLRRGIERAALRSSAPQLRALLAGDDVFHLRDVAPDCLAVALAPGASFALAAGPLDARARLVVPLDAPHALHIHAGGAAAQVRSNAALVAGAAPLRVANPGASAARCLCVDVWHPQVEAGERAAFLGIAHALSVFDADWRDLP